MNMLSPLIWVWPAGSIRKVLFPGRLLARSELSGLGFTPVPHSQGFYFEARVSLSSPTSPQTCLTGWTRCGLLTRLQKSFICAFRRSNLDLIKGACLLILFIGSCSASSRHWRALWLKLAVTHGGLWYLFVQTRRHYSEAVMKYLSKLAHILSLSYKDIQSLLLLMMFLWKKATWGHAQKPETTLRNW